MYPTDIYDWSNDPNDYENNKSYHVSDSNWSHNMNRGFKHDTTKDLSQHAKLTCFEKSKVRVLFIVDRGRVGNLWQHILQSDTITG